MKRGDIVIVAVPGDYGKPRPALVIQADAFLEHASVTVLLMTSERVEAKFERIGVEPGATNGLTRRSDIMIDKAKTLRRERVGGIIGHVERSTMRAVREALTRFLDLRDDGG